MTSCAMTSLETIPASCCVALKEWAATGRALEAGQQIILLRKGGILDEDGAFHLEHREFWLLPTYEHQDITLVKSSWRSLVENSRPQAGENREFVLLRWWARVEQVWALHEDDEAALRAARHIWSGNYLDLRLGYKPERPLLCAALRVYALPQAHRIAMQPEFGGCRSWIELREPLELAGARPALSETEFAAQLAALERILPGAEAVPSR